MEVDKHNPKYKVGTILRYHKDVVKHTGTREVKAGAYFRITGFGPGVFQPPGGRMSYFMILCSKSGNQKKYRNGWNQEYVETSANWELIRAGV